MLNFFKRKPKVGEIWYVSNEFSIDYGNDFEIVKIDEKGVHFIELKWKNSKMWGQPHIRTMDTFLTCYKFNKEANEKENN